MGPLGVVFLILFIIALLAGGALSYYTFNKGKAEIEKKFADAGKTAEGIIDDAKKEGEKRQKELVSEAKKEISALKQEHEKEVRDRKQEIADLEKKVDQREDRLDARSLSLDKREDALVLKENKIENQKIALDKRSEKIWIWVGSGGQQREWRTV